MSTQEEILKGEEAIALFLNWRKGKDNDPRWGKEWFNADGVRMGKVLNFSTDWNALMSVVEKIEANASVDTFTIFYDSILGLSVSVTPFFRDTFDRIVVNKPGVSKIEAVFMSVLKFIKWHETNKTLEL